MQFLGGIHDGQFRIDMKKKRADPELVVATVLKKTLHPKAVTKIEEEKRKSKSQLFNPTIHRDWLTLWITFLNLCIFLGIHEVKTVVRSEKELFIEGAAEEIAIEAKNSGIKAEAVQGVPVKDEADTEPHLPENPRKARTVTISGEVSRFWSKNGIWNW